jgi:hypothetical protein
MQSSAFRRLHPRKERAVHVSEYFSIADCLAGKVWPWTAARRAFLTLHTSKHAKNESFLRAWRNESGVMANVEGGSGYVCTEPFYNALLTRWMRSALAAKENVC